MAWPRFQFRLLSLLVVVTIIGAGLGVHVRLRELEHQSHVHRREARRCRVLAQVASMFASDEWGFDVTKAFSEIAGALDESRVEIADTRACWQIIDTEFHRIRSRPGVAHIVDSRNTASIQAMAQRAEILHQAADYHTHVAHAFENARYHPWYVSLPVQCKSAAGGRPVQK